MEVSQRALKLSARQLWLRGYSTSLYRDARCPAGVPQGVLILLWFAKGVKELQGEAGEAVHFQTGIYTPLIRSTAAQAEWHDMNVVRKAAANSHHSHSSPHTCEGNVGIPGSVLHSLCHQERYLVSEKAGRHGAEMAGGNRRGQLV